MIVAPTKQGTKAVPDNGINIICHYTGVGVYICYIETLQLWKSINLFLMKQILIKIILFDCASHASASTIIYGFRKHVTFGKVI